MERIGFCGFAAHSASFLPLDSISARTVGSRKFTGQSVVYQISAKSYETKVIKPVFPREGWKSRKPIIADIYV